MVGERQYHYDESYDALCITCFTHYSSDRSQVAVINSLSLLSGWEDRGDEVTPLGPSVPSVTRVKFDLRHWASLGSPFLYN